MKHVAITILIFFLTVSRADLQEAGDKWLWLEAVGGTNAMAWMNGQNLPTAESLKPKPEFEELYQQALFVLNSASRIPSVQQKGEWIYTFWKDASHPRGIYRRATLEEFRNTNPNWQTV